MSGHREPAMTDRKPPKSDARIGGMVAAAVLVFLALFTALIIWIA
jgi:hypothetical protein